MKNMVATRGWMGIRTGRRVNACPAVVLTAARSAIGECMNNALRWAAVPFATVLAWIVTFYAAGIFFFMYSLFDRAPDAYQNFFFDYLYLPIRNAISTFAFVVAGKFTAPSHNKIVGIILATIAPMITIGMSIFVIVTMNVTGITDYIKMLLNFIMVIVGVVYAANFHNEDFNDEV